MSRKLVLCFVAPLLVVACSGSTGNPSTPAGAAPSPVSTPNGTEAPVSVVTLPAAATTFKSMLYGYSIDLPAGWSSAPATLEWDGASAPGNDDASVDKFAGPSTVSAFAFAGPAMVELDELVQNTIKWTVRDHGDTCPTAAPEVVETIKIGGEPGRLLGWNCGILINQAVTLHEGVAFTMVMRDPDVQAATDTADRAILEQLLESVVFSG